jgi:hypothetical protein
MRLGLNIFIAAQVNLKGKHLLSNQMYYVDQMIKKTIRKLRGPEFEASHWMCAYFARDL